jgi:uncharacterized protein (DUF952 family)
VVSEVELMNERLILHVTFLKDWNASLQTGNYSADTLATEGFIHCSKVDQVVRVANFLFQNRKNLLLLCIDSKKPALLRGSGKWSSDLSEVMLRGISEEHGFSLNCCRTIFS